MEWIKSIDECTKCIAPIFTQEQYTTLLCVIKYVHVCIYIYKNTESHAFCGPLSANVSGAGPAVGSVQ